MGMKDLFQVVRALFAQKVLHQDRPLSPMNGEIVQQVEMVGESLPAGGPRMISRWDTVLPPPDFATTAPATTDRRPNDPALKKKILIVEDNYLLAELISNLARDCGFEPVGPTGQLQEGCRLAREKAFDGALLDVKLGRDFCYPIASILKVREIPFLFVTGWCDSSLLPVEFRDVARLRKPFENDEVRAALASMLYGLDAKCAPAVATDVLAPDVPLPGPPSV
jgi:CheY-like chemotaxis protein